MHKKSDNAQWEAIADDYDVRVGDDGNSFHRNLIRPATLRLLDPQPDERILDVACGNGVFSRYLAGLGVNVTAFDYSPKMIDFAKERCVAFARHISFSVADATDYNQLIALGAGQPFDKIVSNMAVMGLPDIQPLFRAAYEMMKPDGVFVFSATHPCFQTPGRDFTEDGTGLITYDYIEPQRYSYQILADNEKSAYHWHRSLQDLLGICFSTGFMMDGLEEPVYTLGECTHPVWTKVPLPIVVRLRKMKVKNYYE
ncbi:MAG: class I SAM-dependent methyltransferase [Eubacteriales bacterium]|nr:class I SAM-dependent methyltransferase [Bacteroidales bacterium]MDD4494620.1 class I SAM-dependent methyltransferase [Eubacteriales bacterium]